MADEQNTHESGMIDSRTGVESWPCGNPAPLHPSHPLAWTWFSCLKGTPPSLPVMEKGDCFEYSHFYFWLCEHEATCTAVSGRQTCMFHANISTTVFQNIFSVRLILKKKTRNEIKDFYCSIVPIYTLGIDHNLPCRLKFSICGQSVCMDRKCVCVLGIVWRLTQAQWTLLWFVYSWSERL